MPVVLGKIRWQRQQQANWCWCAVSSMISFAYDTTSVFSQCQIATDVLGVGDCCPNQDICNRQDSLFSGLADTGNLRAGGRIPQPMEPAALNSELSAGRPVGAIMTVAGGGAHAVVISACAGSDEDAVLEIQDPEIGTCHLAFSEFRDCYRNKMAWAESYLTQGAT